uniref:Uncharacterized protein n=1 Tax=Strongyloides stercoralis TaxID=6248 RepID=A0A0K0EFL7_STRER
MKFFFEKNSFSNNADYDKESIHYYFCFGGCCSTGTEAEAWRFFWKKLEDVVLLVLNFRHRAFFLMGEIYLYCCFGGRYSTGTESGEWRLFWRELEYVTILQLSLKHGNSSVRIEGCCFTGAESRA